MSLNDFEYLKDPEDLATFSTFTEEDVEVFEFSIAKAILKREEAHSAINSLVDTAGESWFELGQKLTEKRFFDILDEFENKLADSEEDARMTIHVIREMFKDAGDDGDRG